MQGKFLFQTMYHAVSIAFYLHYPRSCMMLLAVGLVLGKNELSSDYDADDALNI